MSLLLGLRETLNFADSLAFVLGSRATQKQCLLD